jgi:hypothetical protein
MPVFDKIDAIFHAPEMSRTLADSLSLLPTRNPDDELRAMIARVEGKFESSRNYPVVLQFIQDHSRLRDAEVMKLFEFIYSSMVNKFKGELGEVLARASLLKFLPMLPANAELILGSEILSRQIRRRNGWYPAADALYCVRDGDALEIIAVAEIKSKATPLPDMREQVERNILRLRRGLRLRGEEVPAERIHVRTAGGVSMPIADVDPTVAREVTALMIVPFRAATSAVPVPHPIDPHVWLAELPWPQDDITEAAYRLMSWYFARIGPKVFHYRAEPPPPGDRRRPAAHDDLPLEENGRHAFLEAIYHTTGRLGFDPREVPVRGKRTPWQTLLWLYNSLGFGYDQATADEFMFPPFKPSEESDARLARRDAAVAAYRAGRFAEGLAQLPDPAEQKDRWWARREWVMLARMHARNVDAMHAREALAHATSMPPIESLSLPIEIGAVEALIELAAGDRNAASTRLASAMETLARVRAEVRRHEENGWELPSDIEPNSAREGVIDLAVAHAALGDCATAIALLERLRQLRGWELDFFATDVLLSPCMIGEALARLRELTAQRGAFAIF